MVRFLDKEKERHLLDALFGLMHENMHTIAPSAMPREAEKKLWISCISDALTKPPRQIALLFSGDELAGFCMYYVNGGVFMIEELQLQRNFGHTTLIMELVRFLGCVLPRDVRFLEAFTDRRNERSRVLMERLGMEQVEEDGSFLHYRGKMDTIYRWIGK